MEWFLSCLSRALDGVEDTLATVFTKARFWQSCAALAKCSQDTALRDIQDLIGHGLLRKDPSGCRSTSYHLTEREEPW